MGSNSNILKRGIGLFILILGIIFLNKIAVLALDEVTYKAMLDKEKVKIGEQFQYMVIVNYEKNTMVPNITPPSFIQLKVINKFQNITEQQDDNQTYLVLRKVWLLEPTETGKISIASAIITYQDGTTNLLEKGKTDILFLEVEPAEEVSPVSEENSATASNKKKNNLPDFKWLFIIAIAVIIIIVLLIVIKLLSSKLENNTGIKIEDQALKGLQKAIAYLEEDRVSEYYGVLTQVLFDYIQKKFNFEAHLLATDSLLEKLVEFKLSQDIITLLKDFLTITDKIKFAGYTPTEEEIVNLHKTIENFINLGRKVKIKHKKVKSKLKEEADDESII